MSIENTLMYSEIMETPAKLKTVKAENAEALKDLVRDIKKAKPAGIVIAARGTSDHAGIFAKYLFETWCGLPVALAAPSVYTAYDGKLNLKNHLVIGISQSGRAADATEVLTRAAADGALTLAITNYKDSPMAAAAKHHLFCGMGEEKSVAATKTFTADLYLILALAAAWTKAPELKETLKTAPAAVARACKTAAAYIEFDTARYRFADESFVLGRGYAYALAMEFALKTKETCYVRSRAYPTSDFYHGPIAQISRGTPVFLFALGERFAKDSGDMLDRLKTEGADVFVFTDDAELIARADAGYILEGGNELLNVFSATAAMQLFACSLSVKKGLSPDSPRGLNKVTITR